MSENDSESGSGRKGFVRDVMRRIAPSTGRPGDEPEADPRRAGDDRAANEAERLHDAMRFFGSDSNEFRHRLDRMLADFETLRRRYEQVRTQHHDAERQNEKLVCLRKSTSASSGIATPPLSANRAAVLACGPNGLSIVSSALPVYAPG